MTKFAEAHGIAASLVVLAVIVVAVAGAATAYVTLDVNGSSTVTTASSTTTYLPPVNVTTQQGTTQSSTSDSNTSAASVQTVQQNATDPFQIPVSYASVNSSMGLGLSLQLSGFPNGTLKITATESNTMNAFNNVSAAQDWPYSQGVLQSYSSAYGSSSNILLPMGVAIFSGYLDAGDYASAQPLTLCNDAIQGTSCTASGPTPTSYGYSPASDYAAVYAPQFVGNYATQLETLTSGSWTGGSTSPQFTAFPLGNYTVIAGDEWGQLLILHFGVVTVHGSSSQPYSPLVGTARLQSQD